MSDLIELKDKTLIDLLLEEQQTLDTPVGRFAEEAESTGAPEHSDLIPLSAPKPGEQYAFKVNLDLCSGCKGCVTACHSLNGLDENETWRDVGLLLGENESGAYQQTVTTACHHCVDPACLNGCPVNAYEKDPVSGIVLHLDDQCIGCQYCVLKCPYDVPKYSSKRGIVRKCDMCHSRLSSGEAPACVQACPHGAITITTVDKGEASERSRDPESFLPDAPEPAYTQPTTRYVSKKQLPKRMVAGDAHVLRPQHTHWPLVGLLALSQIGIGGHLGLAALWNQLEVGAATLALGAFWAILHAGLLCSVLHLGQPLKAWRIFVGFKHSWLSREAVALGVVSALSTSAFAMSVGNYFGVSIPVVETGAFVPLALWASSLMGLVGVMTSVFIYVDTQRSFWRMSYTGSKFYGSVMLGGLASIALASGQDPLLFSLAFSVVVFGKLVLEVRSIQDNFQSEGIATKVLSTLWKSRLTLGAGVGILVPVLSFSLNQPALFLVALLGVVASEVMERIIYFKAVNAPKMPGGLNG
ncbi:DmsC/YnfH family molybdoenzyme membrane anchor subunit [Pelagicoccus sp. SDUM812003]|uniref:DmsC/YnfH family molybdoenzyme membrane anchor subunit n=1 Tax=Pelagicoccus sp. SDUM812003 TaxID=3041267 RepID=UPI00280DDDCB|nr:DmsC/YnfH family molybdoenzyme membrane anchor subunit [Pelagicoccus sp. SDUM812003]MDQ8203788.1 dimethyl sulfoxide reductase anchor subunit [Pelagicoccus sp. SDUM812003]